MPTAPEVRGRIPHTGQLLLRLTRNKPDVIAAFKTKMSEKVRRNAKTCITSFSVLQQDSRFSFKFISFFQSKVD